MEELKNKLDSVIRFSQKFDDAELYTDDLLSKWKNNKGDFIELIEKCGNSSCPYIYEYPEKVYFSLSAESKHKYFNEFVASVNYYDSWELEEFLKQNEEGFYNNTVVKSYTFENSEKHTITIPKGMKLLKAFKFFNFHPDTLRILQDKASFYIQKDKISGILCFSVHPLDYLSSSETTYNWRSCHSLDGDFRAGNLSYIVDSSTVVCYLKADTDSFLPNFPFAWNDKKWRVLLHFSNDRTMMFAGRQYPFNLDGSLNFIKDKILNNIGMGCFWSEWTSDKLARFGPINFSKPLIPLKEKMVPITELVKNGKNSLQFNDVLQSNYYEPQYSYLSFSEATLKLAYYEVKDDTSFVIGEEVKCICCGKNNITDSAVFYCDDCEGKYWPEYYDIRYCDICERPINFEDVYNINDDYGNLYCLCPSCFDSETGECDICGHVDFIQSMYYDVKTNKHYCNCHRKQHIKPFISL